MIERYSLERTMLVGQAASDRKLAIVGLGYVGLPLAVEFGKTRPVIGFDINRDRVQELQSGRDSTLEVTPDELRRAEYLHYSSDPAALAACDLFIITVPTPIDRANRPDLTPLIKASETVGRFLKKGAIAIYESTVYPGCTEEVCVPVLERFSALKYNIDFFCGYSPERIVPGDKINTLTNIKKITSGSTPEVAELVNGLYSSIVKAGTHKASSIKVAEAAKVVENIQRDVNIALMNELALIFHRLSIDTLEVIQAASTKWNFLPFKPGLVGGHCIGVDPYYLAHKAQEVGYHPEVILAGRRVNNNIVAHIVEVLVKLMVQRRFDVARSRILVLGLTFKEDCPDLRNSKVLDVVRALSRYHAKVDVYDPWVDSGDVLREHRIDCLAREPEFGMYSAILVAVAHSVFQKWGPSHIRSFGTRDAVVFDVKGILPAEMADARL